MNFDKNDVLYFSKNSTMKANYSKILGLANMSKRFYNRSIPLQNSIQCQSIDDQHIQSLLEMKSGHALHTLQNIMKNMDPINLKILHDKLYNIKEIEKGKLLTHNRISIGIIPFGISIFNFATGMHNHLDGLNPFIFIGGFFGLMCVITNECECQTIKNRINISEKLVDLVITKIKPLK